MKPINFIKTKPYKNQIAITRWQKISFMLTLLCVIIILGIHSRQLIHAYEIYSEQKVLTQELQSSRPMIDRYQQLIEQQKLLQKKQIKISAVHRSLEKSRGFIHMATMLHKNGGHLESLTVHKKNIALTASCESCEKASTCLEELQQQTPSYLLNLTSLQSSPHAQHVMFEIKGQLKK